ncbi:hypothetical protein DFA_11744 [Cavenderia fasciculata]|uniref:SKP1 component POZ domain-containing protein n=1 Tax=Cavenderia fasciculata TaxID=261658 RepID=F4QE36_CACFS|nr:uncharacterized protein DFA_11744 [Cavenderia fasciculata]EGG13983.1 hypothetical protein DFA_11744 [Cavenderia fasciculata]|eukprot:XP_004350691.1 hypothetical protein DFA_11744 [Cavenderia fasciculata]
MEESTISTNIDTMTNDSSDNGTDTMVGEIIPTTSTTSTTTTTISTNTSAASGLNRKVVKIVSNEGDEYELEECVIEMCRTVKYIASGKLGFRNGLGGWFNIEGKYVLHKKEGRLLATIYTNNDQECILCFPEIRGQILSTIIEYCKFHSSNPTSQQILEHDDNLISMKQSSLCELASASYYLDVKSLVSLTSREIAAQISQKSSEEIRETFTNLHLAGYNQFFSSNKQCPSYKKSSKKEKLQIVAPTTLAIDDNRSVDELLEFLGESSKKPTSKKNKNKSSSSSTSSTSSTSNTTQQSKLNSSSTLPSQQQQQPSQQSNNNSKSNNNNKSSSSVNNNNNNKQTSPIILPNKSKSTTNSSTSSTIGNIQQQQQQIPDISLTNNKKQSKSSSTSLKSSKSSPDLFSSEERTDNLYHTTQQKQDPSMETETFEEEWDDDDDDEIDPDLQEEIDKEVESFKQRLDLFNRQPKTKLTLPSRTLAALLDAY